MNNNQVAHHSDNYMCYFPINGLIHTLGMYFLRLLRRSLLIFLMGLYQDGGCMDSARLLPVSLSLDHDIARFCTKVSLVSGMIVKMSGLHLVSPDSPFYNQVFPRWHLCLQDALTHPALPYQKLLSGKEQVFYLVDCH